MKRKLIILLSLLIFCIPIIAQVCISNTAGGLDKNASQSYGCGNSFIPNSCDIIRGLTVFGSSINGTSDVTLSIYEGDGVNGTLLRQVSGLSIIANQPNTFSFPEIPVIPGNTYTWYLSSSNIVDLKGGLGNYPDGIFYISSIPGGANPSGIDIVDADFEILVDVTPIPTLSQWGIITLSMIMLILGVVAVRQRRVIFG